MSNESKPQGSGTPAVPATPQTSTPSDDQKIKDQIERKVIEHIVRIESEEKKPQDDKGQTSTPQSTPVTGATALADIETLKKQLEEKEKERKKAQDELLSMQSKMTVKDQELKQKQDILQSLALKEFEEKKGILVDTVRKSLGDEKADEVSDMLQSGEDIDRVERMLTIVGDSIKTTQTAQTGQQPQTPKKPTSTPAGKISADFVPSLSKSDVDEWDSVEEMVNDIYDNLETQLFLKERPLKGMSYDDAKLKKYQSMATKLLQSVLLGEKSRGGKEGTPTKIQVTQCLQCGKVLVAGERKCPNCGKDIIAGRG